VGLYINADDIKKQRGSGDMEAAREAEYLRELCLKERRDFTFETVLSTERNIHLLERAKKAGYYIEGVYVLTSDVELNILRVTSRVQSGGHNVPEEKIRNRYDKSLANIPVLVQLCDVCYVIDNTDEPVVICYKSSLEQLIWENRYWPGERILELVERESVQNGQGQKP
jgi:predicted ABC-type ATPase